MDTSTCVGVWGSGYELATVIWRLCKADEVLENTTAKDTREEDIQVDPLSKEEVAPKVDLAARALGSVRLNT